MNSISIKAQALKGFGICLLVGGLLWGAGEVQTSPVDVGLVTKLSGEATYFNQTDQKQPVQVQAFMKIRQGDHFKLPAASLVQLVYFDNGRQETWRGPVTFIAGLGESRAEGEKSPQSQPEVQVLPTKVTKRLMAPGMPLPRSSMRYSGAIPLMAAKPKAVGQPGEVAKMAEEAASPPTVARRPLSQEEREVAKMSDKAASPPTVASRPPLSQEERQEIKEAEQIYQSLRKKTPEDDFTPELYFLGVLAEYGQYSKMAKILDAMLAKKPGDSTLKDLKAWVRSQPEPPGGPVSP